MTAAGLDLAVAELVRRAASPGADGAFRALSALASGPATLAMLALAAAALAAGGGAGRRLAPVPLVAWCASEVVVHAAKALVARARPSYPYTFDVLATAAFPSGHAANAVVTFGLLALLAGARWPRRRRAARVAAVALALGAGLSRVYLGVHWATDVLAGWAVGAVVLALAVAAMRRTPGPGRGAP